MISFDWEARARELVGTVANLREREQAAVRELRAMQRMTVAEFTEWRAAAARGMAAEADAVIRFHRSNGSDAAAGT
jgi:hypothetical protein